ncbi:MAG: PrsW family glutamic-type intramembrane protease [Proteobacteria bacterium]|nr:PrsW family glutamic-type intramembrane protease [Pseudomonadota bacterium]
MTWLVALSGALPALVTMAVLDRIAPRPVPTQLRQLVVLLGALSMLPVLAIELGVPSSTGTAPIVILTAGVEEGCKLAVIAWIVWRRPELDERMDAIVYAAYAGLGFALVENVASLALRPSAGMWISRALLVVPGHAMWSAMIGAAAARRRYDRRGLGLFGGYLLAVAFQGASDGAMVVGSVFHVIPVTLTVIAFFVVRTMAVTARRRDDADAATRAVSAARARR